MESTRTRRRPVAACALAGALIGGLVIADATVPAESASAGQVSKFAAAFTKANKRGIGFKGYKQGKQYSGSDISSPKGALATYLNNEPSSEILSVDVENVVIGLPGVIGGPRARKNSIVTMRLPDGEASGSGTAQIMAPDGSIVERDVLTLDSGAVLNEVIEVAATGHPVGAQQGIRRGRIDIKDSSGRSAKGMIETTSDNGLIRSWKFESDNTISGKVNHLFGPQHFSNKASNQEVFTRILPPVSVKPKNLDPASVFTNKVPGKHSKHKWAWVQTEDVRENGVVRVDLYSHEANGWKKASGAPFITTNWDKAQVKAANQKLLAGTTIPSVLTGPYRLVKAAHTVSGERVPLEGIIKQGENGKKDEVVWWQPATSDNPFKPTQP